MDYFDKQRQLILSPVMYREKDSFYLFSQCKRNNYKLNKDGSCIAWDNDFKKLCILLREIDIELSDINKEEFFSIDTITIINEINGWIEWMLDVDYTIPDAEKEKIYFFDVRAEMNKTFYTIAKICDDANSIEKLTDVYRVSFKGDNLREIEMMYYLRSGWDWNIYSEKEGIIASYLVKYSKIYRMIISSRDMLKQLEENYGYYTVPKSIKEKIFYAIQKKSKQIQKETDELYTSMLLEKRVKTKWGNEYHLFELINKYNCHTQYQYHSGWLGKQSLDIYISDCKIGVEYQGEQHYKAIDIWGGEAALKENQIRDLRKKNLCAENGVLLLEWSYKCPVNEKNVLRFMKENNIPLAEKVLDEQMWHEMAPIILNKNVESKKRKPKKKNIKYYIVQYDFDGIYVNKYENICSAARKVEVSSSSISKVLRGERNSAAGFIWRKIDISEEIAEQIEVDFDIEKTNSGRAKKIVQLDSGGQIVRKFKSISDAVRKTGISWEHIQKELLKETSDEWKNL